MISFLKQFKKLFFHLIEHALRSLLVFKYLWLFLRKSKITAGDTLNSRLSIYVPKKVFVKKDVIYIKNCSRARLISQAKPGRTASIIYRWRLPLRNKDNCSEMNIPQSSKESWCLRLDLKDSFFGDLDGPVLKVLLWCLVFDANLTTLSTYLGKTNLPSLSHI